MLVLTRKLAQSIVIDGEITVQVLQVQGNRIRLGITAPRAVPIRRGELPPRDAAPKQFADELELAPDVKLADEDGSDCFELTAG